MTDIKRRTRELLLSCCVMPNLLGYEYLVHCISAVHDDPLLIRGLTTVLYPQVADLFGTTWKGVERCIRSAIEKAFDKDSERIVTTLKVPQSFFTGKYTSSEFIALCVEHLKMEVAE